MIPRLTAIYQRVAELTAAPKPGQKAGNLRGIFMMLLAMACFVSGDATMKYMADHMPTGEAMFIRGLIGSTIVGIIAIYTGAIWRIGRFISGMLALRTMSDVGGALFFQNGLARMPFAEAGAITQINPLIVTAGAALFLGEKVGWRRWTATAVGLMGVLLIIRPGAAAFQWASLLMLGATVCSASRDLLTRSIPGGVPAIILAGSSIMAVTLASLLFLPFETWRQPLWSDVATLAISAVCSLSGQVAVVASIRSGDVSAVVPFRYSAILWNLLLGYLIWRQFPDHMTLIGIFIVCSAGLYTFYREQTLRRQARLAAERARETNE